MLIFRLNFRCPFEYIVTVFLSVYIFVAAHSYLKNITYHGANSTGVKFISSGC
jgi:hypothetical protein